MDLLCNEWTAKEGRMNGHDSLAMNHFLRIFSNKLNINHGYKRFIYKHSKLDSILFGLGHSMEGNAHFHRIFLFDQ